MSTPDTVDTARALFSTFVFLNAADTPGIRPGVLLALAFNAVQFHAADPVLRDPPVVCSRLRGLLSFARTAPRPGVCVRLGPVCLSLGRCEVSVHADGPVGDVAAEAARAVAFALACDSIRRRLGAGPGDIQASERVALLRDGLDALDKYAARLRDRHVG